MNLKWGVRLALLFAMPLLGAAAAQAQNYSAPQTGGAAVPTIATCPNGSGGYSPCPLAPVTSTALESSHVLKASGGYLYGLNVAFGTCSTPPCYVMVFDAASAPANGAVTPKRAWAVSANSSLSVTEAPALAFTNGIVVVCSTSGPFTLTATPQCFISGDAK